MNEKYKELALQAGGSHYPTVNSTQLEKFAQLIVAECIKTIETANCKDLVFTTFDLSMEQGIKKRCVDSIKLKFDNENI